MPAIPKPTPATYQDVLDAPKHLVAEVLSGTLYTHSRPAGPHAEAASVLGMDIGSAFHRGRGGPGGWIILYEPELHFAQDILVPDLAGWHRERLPSVPKSAYFELAPDWVCEVLSPSTALMDRRNKLPIYAREQVPYVWLVDPRARSVEVFELDGEHYRCLAVHGEDEVVRLPPFDAIELELSALWPSDPAEE
ncbi:MAG: Uma2 family endonuclease [Kofleriaceae bacterium]|nr:Uma2 family endonuclease [Kofleriaceae bacterium]